MVVRIPRECAQGPNEQVRLIQGEGHGEDLRRKRPSSSDWTSVGSFIEASLKKMGVSQAVRKVTLEDEVRAWVGESGSRYLSRVSCKTGVLTLEMSHPAWLQETSSRKDELLKTVQDRFPDLKIRDAKVTLAKGGPSHRS